MAAPGQKQTLNPLGGNLQWQVSWDFSKETGLPFYFGGHGGLTRLMTQNKRSYLGIHCW